MIKKYRKNLFLIGIVVILMFYSLWLWTEGFGISNKYPYGSTIAKALNYSYEHKNSNIGFNKIITTVDIKENEKLVLYESNRNTLCCGFVKKKWNGKWIVTSASGELSFKADSYGKGKDKPQIIWIWDNFKEFGITYGVIFDNQINKIEVAGNKASIFYDNAKANLWYFIDKSSASNGKFKPNYDVKAYDKDNKVMYSYF